MLGKTVMRSVYRMCDAVAEWLAYRLLDLYVAGSNPGGDTFRRVITLSRYRKNWNFNCR